MVNPGKQLIKVLAISALCLSVALSCYAMDDFPDEVEIASLENLFEPVEFDHAFHVDVTESCAECHHHTTGAPVVNEYCGKCHNAEQEMDVVACQDCHSADSGSAENLQKTATEYFFHDDKPNLKAAYHLNCLGCHRAMDGPTGCEDCHARTEAGNKFYRSGKFAPEPAAGGSEHH